MMGCKQESNHNPYILLLLLCMCMHVIVLSQTMGKDKQNMSQEIIMGKTLVIKHVSKLFTYRIGAFFLFRYFIVDYKISFYVTHSYCRQS